MTDSANDGLKKISEGYFKLPPKLYVTDTIQELIAAAPDLTDCELEQLGAKLFKRTKPAELVAEGRE